MKTEPVTVRYRSIAIVIRPWHPKPHLTHWRYYAGERMVSRSTLDRAKDSAKAHAESVWLGTAPIGGLTDSQTRAIRRLLEEDATLSCVDDYLAWRRARKTGIGLGEARRLFLAAKVDAEGLSTHHVENLRRKLASLPDVPLADFALRDFPGLSGAPRTRRNSILVWRQFFRWARKQGYLPDEPTVADRIETPKVPRKQPEVYSPAELAVLLGAVGDEYLSWLSLSAWAGIRQEELCTTGKSRKDVLEWSDIVMNKRIIVVRPSVSKTGHKRVVPICDSLYAVLSACYGSGPVVPGVAPHRQRWTRKNGKLAQESETQRLGALVGGWRRNALRHSFISYRAAQVGLGQTALEAGNSEAEAKSSYLDATTEAEAAAWFLLPAAFQKRLGSRLRALPFTGNLQVDSDFHLPPVSANP